MLNDNQVKVLEDYITRLRNKYNYDNPDLKHYSSDYITGLRDCLSFIEYKLMEVKTINMASMV